MHNPDQIRCPLILLLIVTPLLIGLVFALAFSNMDEDNASSSTSAEEEVSHEYISELESENDSLRERIVEQNAQIEELRETISHKEGTR